MRATPPESSPLDTATTLDTEVGTAPGQPATPEEDQMPEQPRGRHAAPDSAAVGSWYIRRPDGFDGDRSGRHEATAVTEYGPVAEARPAPITSAEPTPLNGTDWVIHVPEWSSIPPEIPRDGLATADVVLTDQTHPNDSPSPQHQSHPDLQALPDQQTPADKQPPHDRQASDAIVVHGLHKKFGEMVAVDDVSFTVPTGSIVALLGPNGAGKTTTVNMLCTLLKPDAGTALVAGHDIVSAAPGVRRSISLTGQFAALDESLSGRENLILFGRLLGLDKSAARGRADELLEMFDLTHARARRVREYSGGMRRRIDIACGLVTSPRVVFLDEPTTGLDPRSRHEVWSLVANLRAAGVTVLLTTQYLEEADVLSDHIVVIDHGRVIASGTADELKSATGSTFCEVTTVFPDEAHRLLGLLADLSPDLTAGPGTVSVPAPDGAQTLVEVVRRASEADIDLSDVVMRRPSLDEVFLSLTASEAAPR